MLVTRMLNDTGKTGIITMVIVEVMAAADITVIQDGSAGELTNTSDMSYHQPSHQGCPKDEVAVPPRQVGQEGESLV